jgi:hypothetical protein
VKGDPGKAEGLRKMAESRLKVVDSAGINGDTAAVLFGNIYEGLKSLVLSRMARKGYAPKSHIAIVAFARDVTELPKEEVAFFDSMRVLRNDVVYRGRALTDAKFVRKCRDLLEKWLEYYPG